MKILIIQNTDKTLGEQMDVTKMHLSQIKALAQNATVKTAETKKDIASFLPSADIVITPRIQELDFQKAPNLKWVHVNSAGVDMVPSEIMESQILLTNSSGVHPVPIAEQVFTYMLMFSRGMHKTYRTQIEKKKWVREYDKLQPNELYGKTIGIVGLGRIGQRIAEVASGFTMDVVAMVRNANVEEKYIDRLYSTKQLDNLLKISDFVINCLPLTQETYQLFNARKFGIMKKNAIFINIGRGQIVNEKDLVKALKSGTIAGAGLDVFEEEPLPASSQLWKLPNVILTPHYAGWTPYYMDRVINIFCKNLEAYLEQKTMPNLINKQKGY